MFLPDLLEAVGNQTLASVNFETINEIATTVVMVSGGYPGNFEKGKRIQGLEDAKSSLVFHSGTIQDGDNVLTNGGRVFAITSFGRSVEDAVQRSFLVADAIKYEGKYFRRDIGRDLMG